MISLMPMYEIYFQEIYGNAATMFLIAYFKLMNNRKSKQLLN